MSSNRTTDIDAPRKSCPTKSVLYEAWRNVANAYASAVSELLQQISTLPKTEYEKLSHSAENARKRAFEAQASFEAHVSDHGCGNNSREFAA